MLEHKDPRVYKEKLVLKELKVVKVILEHKVLKVVREQ